MYVSYVVHKIALPCGHHCMDILWKVIISFAENPMHYDNYTGVYINTFSIIMVQLNCLASSHVYYITRTIVSKCKQLM